MKILIPKNKIADLTLAIRRCGYGLLRDRRTGQESFVKRIHHDLYPRFHLYVENAGANWSLNLHLDQRAPVYRGVTAHSGDYEGPVVEAEGERIKKLIS